MIVPDVNLLLYAYDSDSLFHDKAAAWWRKCLSGAEPVGLASAVVFGFTRVGTSARAYRHPMAVGEAAGHVRSWLQIPVVEVVDPGPGHIDQVLKLLENLGAAGNLVTDAQIAALAIEQGAVLHTADADFQRFPELRWYNPITGATSRRLKK
jgi:toxin-antitoxin system PIN domain toxin